MVIGIVGSRNRNEIEDKNLIEDELIKIMNENKDIIICSGGCKKGGDLFAEQLSNKYKLQKKIFEAEWNKYKKGAGFIRNTDIARESDVLIACISADRKGGTEDTIKKFKKFHPKGRLILV